MGCLSAKDLLTPKSLKTVKHPMPLWGQGAYVNVKALSSRDLIELQADYGKGVEDSQSFEFACHLLAFCLVDDKGKRIFSSDAEVKGLLDQSPKVIEELGEVAIEVSGIGAEQKKTSRRRKS